MIYVHGPHVYIFEYVYMVALLPVDDKVQSLNLKFSRNICDDITANLFTIIAYNRSHFLFNMFTHAGNVVDCDQVIHQQH